MVSSILFFMSCIMPDMGGLDQWEISGAAESAQVRPLKGAPPDGHYLNTQMLEIWSAQA